MEKSFQCILKEHTYSEHSNDDSSCMLWHMTLVPARLNQLDLLSANRTKKLLPNIGLKENKTKKTEASCPLNKRRSI